MPFIYPSLFLSPKSQAPDKGGLGETRLETF